MPAPDTRATVSQWLNQIRPPCQPSLALDADGHCIIAGPDDLRCIIELGQQDGNDLLFLYTPLMAVPEQADLALHTLQSALRANLFGLLTGGFYLGLDSRTQTLVLSFSVPADVLDQDLFTNLISEILQLGPRLRKRLQGLGGTSQITGQQIFGRGLMARNTRRSQHA